MRILFIGTVKFSLNTLEKLIQINANIVGVGTKESSTFNHDFESLIPTCEKNNIPHYFITNINDDETIKWIKEVKPDIIFCFGWSELIKEKVLSIPPKGIVGYHPTLLPYNRGRHPLVWSLVLGLSQSGSTFFFMDKSADGGDILSQKKFFIKDNDDASTLYSKVTNIALEQIEEFLPKLINNNYKVIKQDNSLATNWRKRSYLDGIIDFRMNSKTIYNLVRALTKPYMGATIKYKDQLITIWKIEIEENNSYNIEYGKVLKVYNNIIWVKSYDHNIKILEHEFEVLPKEGEYL